MSVIKTFIYFVKNEVQDSKVLQNIRYQFEFIVSCRAYSVLMAINKNFITKQHTRNIEIALNYLQIA